MLPLQRPPVVMLRQQLRRRVPMRQQRLPQSPRPQRLLLHLLLPVAL